MLRVVVAIALLQGPLFDPRFQRFESRGVPGRTDRGLSDDGAMFAFAGTDGRGMTGVCAATNPTGAKGETATVTRGTSATCTSSAAGGLITSGIAVGDLRTVSSNIIRQEYGTNGVLGVLVENAGTADDLRPEELENASWTATATVTANQATPPNNTNQVSNAEQLSDGSAAAFQGVCQTIATSSATQHTFFVHVRAGTTDSAQVTMTGTGSATGDCSATVTGLSSTTWNILSCTSPAAYAGTLTAVTVCVNVGNLATVTGTIMAWGTDHKSSAPYRTSYVPGRTSASAPRAQDTISFPFPVATSPSISLAGSFIGPTPASGSAAGVIELGAAVSFLNESAGLWRWFTAGITQSVAITSSAAGVRTYGYHDGNVEGMRWGPNTAGPTASVSAANKAAATIYVGGNAANRPDGVVTEGCGDVNAGVCR